jgi:large subunit ribosomal protein L20
MSRARSGKVSKRSHKKIIKLAKGYTGRSNNCFRSAVQRVEKGLLYAYRDRKKRKSNFRSLWIQRINASVRNYGIVYSQFIKGLKILNIGLNRKMISEIAIHNPDVFMKVIARVKDALN